MPGLSLLCNFVSPVADMLESLARDRAAHGAEDSRSVMWQDPHTAILSSGYANYPVMHYETPDYRLWIEGVIYQAPESPSQLSLLPTIGEIVAESFADGFDITLNTIMELRREVVFDVHILHTGKVRL